MTPTPLTRRQREILTFITNFVEEQGISPTLEEIAGNFGVNKVTIFGHVRELERKGAITKGDRHTSRSIQPSQEAPRERGTVQILGRIAAGAPIETVEHPEELSLQDLVPPGGEVYALRVKGDSMIEDAICDGDLVLVERREEARVVRRERRRGRWVVMQAGAGKWDDGDDGDDEGASVDARPAPRDGSS